MRPVAQPQSEFDCLISITATLSTFANEYIQLSLMSRSKTKSLFGKKRKPDSPVLTKQSSKWGLEEHEQWVRQEPTSAAHQQATPHSTKTSHELAKQEQQDWYSAALQQSAQLNDIAKQGESEQGGTMLPEENRQHSKITRRRAAAGQAASQDQDWFSGALQQSARLDSDGFRMQAEARG